eukprot:SAG11_NODE_856_length_6864_cov_12.741168_2_plen_176_part_00
MRAASTAVVDQPAPERTEQIYVTAADTAERRIALLAGQRVEFTAKIVEGGGALTLGLDFGFSAVFHTEITRLKRQAEIVEVVPLVRGQQKAGTYSSDVDGTLVLTFDNSFSWSMSKTIDFTYTVGATSEFELQPDECVRQAELSLPVLSARAQWCLPSVLKEPPLRVVYAGSCTR